MAEEKVFLDANSLYMDSFKLARAIWDDGYRPTVRTAPSYFVGSGFSGFRAPCSVAPCATLTPSVAFSAPAVPHRPVARRHPHRHLRRGVLPRPGALAVHGSVGRGSPAAVRLPLTERRVGRATGRSTAPSRPSRTPASALATLSAPSTCVSRGHPLSRCVHSLAARLCAGLRFEPPHRDGQRGGQAARHRRRVRHGCAVAPHPAPLGPLDPSPSPRELSEPWLLRRGFSAQGTRSRRSSRRSTAWRGEIHRRSARAACTTSPR